MRYLVASIPDPASRNIAARLHDIAKWNKVGHFDGAPVLELVDHRFIDDGDDKLLARPGKVQLITLQERHLYAELLEEKITEAGLEEPELICVLSRHTAASGKPTLTLHPTGNYGTADYGGAPERLSISAPRWTTGALRALTRESEAAGLEHGVSFEVTHHGPELNTPAFYIEIGSDESQWPRPEPATAIARALLQTREAGGPVVIGVGGGHYAPRFTDVGRQLQAAFGHMVPAYALKGKELEEQGRLIRMAWERTPGADRKPGDKAVYFHRKGLSKPNHRQLKAWAEDAGYPVLSSTTLKPVD